MRERHITFDMIVQAVCTMSNLTRADILSGRRLEGAGRARTTVYWLARQLIGASMPVIGRLSGGRDHSTIVLGISRAEALRDADLQYRMTTDALLGALRAVERAGVIRLATLVDPLATARRVLANPLHEAMRVPVVEIVAMAQLVVSTFGESDEPIRSPFSITQELNHAA